MKKLPLVIALALAGPVMAGTSASKEVIVPAQPSLWSWFAGASIGELVDFDESMWHVHAGADTPWKVAGWDVAVFAEYGSTETESIGTTGSTIPQIAATALGPNDVYQQLEVKPLTINVKLERPLAAKLNAYAGAGLGVAFVDYTAKVPFFAVDAHDSDEVFAFQAFAGLVYNLTEKVEVFGGARWISVDYDAPAATGVTDPLSFDEDVLYEAGLRYNF